MVTILPFVADPVLYRNPPNHILPLYNIDKQAYISQCSTDSFFHKGNKLCLPSPVVKKTSRALKEMLGASK